jgi:N-acetylmuramic acid 6-phosphate etherase
MPNGNERPALLGIEGGATRTVALLADFQEHLLARIELGPANLRLLSDSALRRILMQVGEKVPVPWAVGIGLAGVRTSEDRERVRAAATAVWPQAPCWPGSDLETALAAAEPLNAKPRVTQVLVLSGTGSCCYGQATDGKTAKLGGWGHILGDKGSAYDIGLRALKAVVYYYDRDGTWSKLGQGLLRALHLNGPEDLIDWVQQAQKAEVGTLALEVFDAWQSRDSIASDILEGAADNLAKDASLCAVKLVRKNGPVQFVLAGSVLLKQPRFARLVSKQLLKRWPKAEVAPLPREGAWGAVRLAQHLFASTNLDRRGRRRVSRGPKGRHAASSFSAAAAPVPTPSPTGLSPTEQRNPRSANLDRMPLSEAIGLMLREEAKVPKILLKNCQRIETCIRMVVRGFRQGGRLFYVGAGTSGRLGTLDASECPPTFRASPEQVQAIMAGGQRALYQSIEGAEDDAAAGAAAVRFRGVTSKDVVMGIAASGRTPFVWGALDQAKHLGARNILICFNPHLKIAPTARPDLVLAPDLGPEVLTGSTRLKAGTATKLLLNLLTTLSMVALGKVAGNLMVDLNPSNEKLRGRAIRIVRELTGAGEPAAQQALEASGWVIKDALKCLGWRRAGPRR